MDNRVILDVTGIPNTKAVCLDLRWIIAIVEEERGDWIRVYMHGGGQIVVAGTESNQRLLSSWGRS